MGGLCREGMSDYFEAPLPLPATVTGDQRWDCVNR